RVEAERLDRDEGGTEARRPADREDHAEEWGTGEPRHRTERGLHRALQERELPDEDKPHHDDDDAENASDDILPLNHEGADRAGEGTDENEDDAEAEHEQQRSEHHPGAGWSLLGTWAVRHAA